MLDTRARRALVRYFEAGGGYTHTSLAAVLGIKQPSVSAWVAGDNRPSDHLRRALEALLGIPARWWMTPAELALVRRVKRVAHVGATGTEG